MTNAPMLAALATLSMSAFNPPPMPTRCPPPREATAEELADARANRDAMVAKAENDAERSAADVQFLPFMMDFGEVLGGSFQWETVRVINLGATPIKVTRVQPGGSVTMMPPWVSDPIEPNCVGEAYIPFKVPEKQGITLNKQVTFIFEGRAPMVYHIKAQVPEIIRVKPDVLVAPRPTTLRLKLIAVDDVPFCVTSVDRSYRVASDEPSNVHHVRLPNFYGGEQHIHITTDHPASENIVLVVYDEDEDDA